MNTDRSRRRKPKGAPTGGQFAPESHAESDVSLAAHSDEGIPAAWTATDSAALDTHIRSAEAADRIDASANPVITDQQLDELLDPERQPVSVRWAVSRLPYAGIAEVAARDPHPVVRAEARRAWDIPGGLAQELDADPAVQRVLAAMVA